MVKYNWILAMSVSLALSQAACVAEPTGTEEETEAVDSDPNAASASAQQICVNQINAFRATRGLKALSRWTGAESCANDEAHKDALSGRAHGAFGECKESAQNECPGWPGPAGSMISGCLKQMWAEGPGSDFSKHGHYINMSSTKYTSVSCGFYTLPNGKVWAVQDFH